MAQTGTNLQLTEKGENYIMVNFIICIFHLSGGCTWVARVAWIQVGVLISP